MAPYSASEKRGFPWKFLVFGVVVGAAIYWGPGLFHKGGGAAPQGMAGGGAPVSIATVVTKPVTEWSEFSGIFQAVNSVEVRPRISGQIMQIHFTDGEIVKKGELLFTIDPRPYEAALITAKASLNEAAPTLARAKKLINSKAISRAEFDAAQSAYDRALGNFKAAELNLEYTRISAPISGKISRAEITVGNLVDAGGTAPLLASIVSLSPIYASFDIDEQNFLKSIQGVPSAKLKKIPVEVGLSNDQGTPIKATIHSFDNQITAGSGTIRVRALVPNADAALVPGLYARVHLGTPDETDAVLINPTAVGTDQNKKFVMLVGKENKAEYREVTLGTMVDGLQVVRSGLTAGDQIIVNGLQRVRPGAPIAGTPVDMLTLKGAEAPADPAATPATDTPAAAQ